MFSYYGNIFKSVNDYISEYLYKNKMILSNEIVKYHENITNTIFKFYYLWVYEKGTYFKLNNNNQIPKESYLIINFIYQKSQIDRVVISYTLIAIYNLVKNGSFPNNWLMPQQKSAKLLFDKLETNPGTIANFLDNALNQLKPLLSTSTEVISQTIEKIDLGKLILPLALVATILGIIYFKPIKRI